MSWSQKACSEISVIDACLKPLYICSCVFEYAPARMPHNLPELIWPSNTSKRLRDVANVFVCVCPPLLSVPSQTVDMPVFFYIDSEMAGDWNCRNINDVTLSYKFHKVCKASALLQQEGVWIGTADLVRLTLVSPKLCYLTIRAAFAPVSFITS